MKATSKVEAEIIAVLDKFSRFYGEKDIEGLISLFAMDKELIFVGTGKDEVRMGIAGVREQIERNWFQSETLSIEFGSYLISASDTTAWVYSDVAAHAIIAGDQMRYTGRLTCVMENIKGKWQIVQWHCSMPDVSQQEGESFSLGRLYVRYEEANQ
ncbi:MAG: nuclear transport factor 2 family protein [Armatimonadota bacterium]